MGGFKFILEGDEISFEDADLGNIYLAKEHAKVAGITDVNLKAALLVFHRRMTEEGLMEEFANGYIRVYIGDTALAHSIDAAHPGKGANFHQATFVNDKPEAHIGGWTSRQSTEKSGSPGEYNDDAIYADTNFKLSGDPKRFHAHIWVKTPGTRTNAIALGAFSTAAGNTFDYRLQTKDVPRGGIGVPTPLVTVFESGSAGAAAAAAPGLREVYRAGDIVTLAVDADIPDPANMQKTMTDNPTNNGGSRLLSGNTTGVPRTNHFDGTTLFEAAGYSPTYWTPQKSIILKSILTEVLSMPGMPYAA